MGLKTILAIILVTVAVYGVSVVTANPNIRGHIWKSTTAKINRNRSEKHITKTRINTSKPLRQIPLSVSYHFSRVCNKSCGFCFHTATTSHIEDSVSAKKGLKLLAEAGMKKINFAGGEPFMHPKFLGDMIDYCKETLHLESVSLVSNGSLIREDFLRKHARNLDILAVSCDSFIESTNIKIGRGDGDQVSKLYLVAEWCRRYGIGFKINTVVNSLNHMEDMNDHIAALQPFRWKCFQVLILPGENDSEAALKDARSFVITGEEFDAFCERHKAQKSLVPEPNHLMADSYLILDEYLRFIDKNGERTSPSILKVSVEAALRSIHWDEKAFVERGGIYDWKKESCVSMGKELEW